MNINLKLKNARIEKGLSLSELSSLTGIAKSTLQRYETGSTKKIPIESISLLEKYLHLTPGYLMGWDEELPAIKPVEHNLTNNEKIFLEEINDLTEEEQQKVLDFIHFTKSQRTKRINLSLGTELAAFGGDFVSKPKKKKPEIL